MTTPTEPDEGRWTEGSLESGADPDTPAEEPAGAEIGLEEGEPTTFEPEEDSG
jgi:hypothetical protein